jgi:hypothetical protein
VSSSSASSVRVPKSKRMRAIAFSRWHLIDLAPATAHFHSA